MTANKDMASLNLHLLDHALSTYVDNSPYSTRLPPSPPHSEVPSTSRNNFLYLVEENGARYEAARSLINDRDYWMKEEMHFQLINNLILDYHCRQDNFVSLADAECPPMDLLRTLLSSMQEQEAALEEPRPPQDPASSCHSHIEACRLGGTKIQKRQRRKPKSKHTIASRTRSKHSLEKVGIGRILKVKPQ